MKKIIIKKNTGNHKKVNEIQNLIHKKYYDIFFAVLIHGSIATAEVITYSDFDGLLIIKDKFKNSILIKEFIKESMKIIYSIDPLQHHGWFIINESRLTSNYPQTYFPYELFEYSKLLYPQHSITFDIVLPQEINYSKPFLNLVSSIKEKLNKGYRPQNVYQLKSILSEFMLLPTFYIQARDKKGVYKKFSFDLARKDFSFNEWNIMDTVTEIRKNWHYEMNIFQKFIMTRPQRLFRKITEKVIAPNIPGDIKIYLDEEFYDKILKLMNKMKENFEKD